jgi:hypothetical protein
MYLITLTSPAGCSSTETVRVTVNPEADVLIILSEPDSIKYCICESDFSGVLRIEAKTVEGATLKYQWEQQRLMLLVIVLTPDLQD